MEQQWTLEKLGGHMYRLHQLWDGTPEMLDWLKEKGFAASSDGSDDYYLDFKEDDEHFNFGVSMSECFQELICVRRFQNDFFHALARNNFDADFGKQLADNGDRIEMLLRCIDLYGVEHALYQYAANYSKSLAEKALRMHQELDESGFVAWLKENVKPRASLNPEDILRYNIVPSKIFECLNLPYAFYDSWSFARENMADYANWIETNELAMKNPAEVFNEFLLNHSNENNKMYALYYWFGCSPCACHLFTMLNSREVTIGVKSLIRKVLTDYGSNNEEFAAKLQHLYDEYKSIAGGIDITFGTTATADGSDIESNEEPQTSKSPAEKTAQQTDDDSEIRDFKDTEPEEKAKILCPIIRELLETNKERVEDFLKDYDLEEVKGMIENILIADAKEYTNIQREIIDDLSGTDHKKSSRYYYKNRLWLLPFFQIIGRLFKWEVLVGKRKQKAFVKALFPEMRCDKDPEFDVVYKEEFDFIETCRNRISKGNTGQPKEWKEKYEWIDKCCK